MKGRDVPALRTFSQVRAPTPLCVLLFLNHSWAPADDPFLHLQPVLPSVYSPFAALARHAAVTTKQQ